MFKLLSNLSDTDFIITVAPSELPEGYPAILNNVYVFTSRKAKTGEEVLLCVKGMAEVDCELGDYLAGEYVYDSDSAPSGVVNKTSGTGRRRVGIVYETKQNANKIKILFDGRYP